MSCTCSILNGLAVRGCSLLFVWILTALAVPRLAPICGSSKTNSFMYFTLVFRKRIYFSLLCIWLGNCVYAILSLRMGQVLIENEDCASVAGKSFDLCLGHYFGCAKYRSSRWMTACDKAVRRSVGVYAYCTSTSTVVQPSPSCFEGPQCSVEVAWQMFGYIAWSSCLSEDSRQSGQLF